MRIIIKVKEENGDKMEDEKNPEKKQDILAKSQCPLTCLRVHKITFFTVHMYNRQTQKVDSVSEEKQNINQWC